MRLGLSDAGQPGLLADHFNAQVEMCPQTAQMTVRRVGSNLLRVPKLAREASEAHGLNDSEEEQEFFCEAWLLP
jgi:hypothetical protein